VFWLGSKHEYAHRVAWALATASQVPKNMKVLHACDNPACCNPAHLRIGTLQDNSNDMCARQRACRGERISTARLTQEQVGAIRRDRARGVLLRDLAAQHGVGLSTVSKVARKKAWAWVEEA
jgi:hypothetical protein